MFYAGIFNLYDCLISTVNTHLRIHMLCIHIYFWQDREGIHQEDNNRA